MYDLICIISYIMDVPNTYLKHCFHRRVSLPEEVVGGGLLSEPAFKLHNTERRGHCDCVKYEARYLLAWYWF